VVTAKVVHVMGMLLLTAGVAVATLTPVNATCPKEDCEGPGVCSSPCGHTGTPAVCFKGNHENGYWATSTTEDKIVALAGQNFCTFDTFTCDPMAPPDCDYMYYLGTSTTAVKWWDDCVANDCPP
jgi:hypothetical protein